LLAVEGSLRLPSIIHDLKQASHYTGVRFELELAALLRRGGFDIEFRPPSQNGKYADLLARRGSEEVFFELKFQEHSKVEKAADSLRDQIMFATSDVMSERFAGTDPPRCVIEVLPEALAMLSGDDLSNAIAITSYVRAVREEILRRRSEPLPIEFSIPRVAAVRIGAACDAYSGIMSPQLPAELELKRIMRGSLKEATEQLSGLRPAILVIKTGSVPAPETAFMMITEWFKRADVDLSNISAVLFIPTVPPLGGKDWLFPAFSICNPNAVVEPSTLGAYRLICRAFAVSEFPASEDA
jgi:Holliday junction resolvase